MKNVLVQAGHKRPQQPGFESQTGAEGEAPLVARIQDALVRRLRDDANFRPIPMPGRIDPVAHVDAALFLHADGVDNPAVHGFCFGYPTGYKVNRDLAELIADEIRKLPGAPTRRGDNPTRDSEYYYGFGLVDTPGPEVLIEHGFVTNPTERTWLNQHVEPIAHAEYAALCRYFGFPVGDHGDRGGHGITPDAAFLAPQRAPRNLAVSYLLARPHGEYSTVDVQNIVGYYYATCPPVGLDPLLLVAQMIEETAHLTSDWSQRPRRNPAGLGVTGRPGEGLSFPSWAAAVRAHAGRVLAYCLAKGTENPAQAKLISEALAYRSLPDDLRGCAVHLKGLVGTWAQDPQYAEKVSSVANDVLQCGAT